jgi:dihydrofolate synthase/folylpolyglutamate synthase
MRVIHNFSDVAKALSAFISDTPPNTPYTLDTIRDLMQYVGNPQDNMKVIHVAGTSGKTSTAYFITSLLTEAGYTTGLTVSPHIDHINERTQINLQPLPEREYCQELAEFLDLVDASGLSPSHFEVLVAFSYWVFNKRKVDYAVVEVGLGGLLDGTNVVTRPDKICVITDIGFDHIDVLGKTLHEIAAQKAGIVHDENKVFMYDQAQEVMEVVRTTVRKKHADLHVIKERSDDRVKHLPTFQQRNFGLALNVAEFVLADGGHEYLSDTHIRQATEVLIPGRMETVQKGSMTLVMDGAHNEQKIDAMVRAMQQKFPNRRVTLLVSFGQNKQTSVQESLNLLRQLGSSIIITKFAKGQDELRTPIEPSELALFAEKAGFSSIKLEEDPFTAVELLHRAQTDIGLITGSLYLIETVRPAALKQ